MRDLAEGVLEDEREQEVYRRQPKRVFQARAGRRSRTSCGAEVVTRGVLPSYTYSNWTEQLFCLTLAWEFRVIRDDFGTHTICPDLYQTAALDVGPRNGPPTPRRYHPLILLGYDF